jgi:hypothetical protein
MGRTACTEPQSLYKGAPYLTEKSYFIENCIFREPTGVSCIKYPPASVIILAAEDSINKEESAFFLKR